MINGTAHRILIVEDDFDTRAVLCDVLELDGYAVVGVGTAKETLAQDDLGEYTAIILDRRLPDGNADELLPQLRELAPAASFIIATGHADLDGTISALRGGASDYILKPINPDLLRASLSRLRQLREAIDRARQAERLAAIGQMITAVAHESRNALQRIQARVELMRMSLEDKPDLLEDLGAIETANQSLRTMFEELREYSAPIHLDKEDIDIERPIKQAWSNLRVSPSHGEASFRIDSASDTSPCHIDPLRIEQVFRNLLENALSACAHPAEIVVKLSDVTIGDRDGIEVSVRDNGSGFSDEQREKAFEPFYTTKSKGTGLGLAISRRIVDAHRGHIAIRAATTEGAEVLVTLPRATC